MESGLDEGLAGLRNIGQRLRIFSISWSRTIAAAMTLAETKSDTAGES